MNNEFQLFALKLLSAMLLIFSLFALFIMHKQREAILSLQSDLRIESYKVCAPIVYNTINEKDLPPLPSFEEQEEARTLKTLNMLQHILD